MKWDTKIRLGVYPFCVELPKDHPFYYAVQEHDTGYDLIEKKIATFTLKQLDKALLFNMLRASVTYYPLWFDKAVKVRESWIAYRAARAWAKYVRPELEAYRPRPNMPPPDYAGKIGLD